MEILQGFSLWNHVIGHPTVQKECDTCSKLILGIKVLSRNEKESVYQKELEIKYYFSSVSPEKGKVEKVQIINLLVLQFCCVH